MRNGKSWSVCLAVILFFAAMVAGCGGGGGGISTSVPTDGINQDSLISDDGMPSIQAMLSAQPDIDAFDESGRRSSSMLVESVAEASSELNGSWTAAGAFDNDDTTWWTGAVATSTWTLSYSLSSAVNMTKVSVMFHSTNYVPASTLLQISSDGTNWTDAGTALSPNANPSFSFAQTSVSYLRLVMNGAPLKGAPSVREVDWIQPKNNTGIFSIPNMNAGKYLPSSMIDGSEGTYWAGTPNVGSWDIYYCFDTPRYIELVTIKYKLLAYIPLNAALYYSNEGESWSYAGAFNNGLSAWGYLGQTTSCVRIAMTGNPPKSYPIVNDIYFDMQPGVASPDTINRNFMPDKATDNNALTWWAGKDGSSSWNFYYTLSSEQTINNVTITWTSNRTVPSTTTMYLSSDGSTWNNITNFPYAVSAVASGGGMAAKYIKLTMSGTPAFGKPAMKQIDVSSEVILVCGDNSVDNGEECDDGNTTSGDGCSATCTNDAKDTNAWITIPAGTFVMGCASADTNCGADESPKHTVTLPEYKIQKYEVTNAQYGACVDASWCTAPVTSNSYTRTPYFSAPTYDNYPVINVSWFQASRYCAYIGGRLPSEAELEKAARGASPSENIYAWGNDTPTCSLTTFYDGADWCNGLDDTTEVGSFPGGSSTYGVMDMAGNVWEFVYDWYDASYYSTGGPTWNDPRGPESGTTRGLKGGSFHHEIIYLNISERNSNNPTYQFPFNGIRCAKDVGTTHTECGNGVVETGEDCDDGNNVSFDGCSVSCTTEGQANCAEITNSEVCETSYCCIWMLGECLEDLFCM